jgi:hypothetical protein
MKRKRTECFKKYIDIKRNVFAIPHQVWRPLVGDLFIDELNDFISVNNLSLPLLSCSEEQLLKDFQKVTLQV